jgi:hypothetical protein
MTIYDDIEYLSSQVVEALDENPRSKEILAKGGYISVFADTRIKDAPSIIIFTSGKGTTLTDLAADQETISSTNVALIAILQGGNPIVVHCDNKDLEDNLVSSIPGSSKQVQQLTLDIPDIDKIDLRYSGSKGDLLDAFEDFILSYDEMIGAYKFNIIKYARRFNQKNGIADLEKAKDYINRLEQYLEKCDKDDKQ